MLANWKKRVFPLNRRQAVFAMLLCLVLAVNGRSLPWMHANVCNAFEKEKKKEEKLT